MLSLLEKTAAHLQKLEADRLAAITVSEEKAWEAQLIGARLEGFRQAMELLGVEPSPTDPAPVKQRRGKRRNIGKLILTELSFSSNAMTTSQIAGAIDYLPELTEKTLRRLESSGQIVREGDGRWSTVVTVPFQSDGVLLANGQAYVRNGQHKRSIGPRVSSNPTRVRNASQRLVSLKLPKTDDTK
jgi:DNA-binding LacI/PurR family transcriptional regulator